MHGDHSALINPRACTGKYVMWMEVHDYQNKLGVAGVATSSLPVIRHAITCGKLLQLNA